MELLFLYLGGRWRIRTADPLLVRQTLWTSWAKRPKAFAVGIGRLLLLPASLARYLKDSSSLSREVFPLKSDAKVESFFELCKCFAKKFHFFLKNREKTRKITVNTDNAVITDNHSNHWYRIYRTILQNHQRNIFAWFYAAISAMEIKALSPLDVSLLYTPLLRSLPAVWLWL